MLSSDCTVLDKRDTAPLKSSFELICTLSLFCLPLFVTETAQAQNLYLFTEDAKSSLYSSCFAARACGTSGQET